MANEPLGGPIPSPFYRDLEKLVNAYPEDADKLLEVLDLSPSSPEGYYASLVFIWMKSRQPIY